MPAWRSVCLLVVLFSFAVSCPAVAGPYRDSAHGSTSSGVDRSSIDPQYSTFVKGNCSHCHEQHSSLGGTEPAPAGSEENPALRFAAEEQLCGTCHDGSPVATNIISEFNKTYRHPVTDHAGRHTLSIDEKGLNGAPFRGLDRHAECSDCHEPHRVQSAVHAAPGNAVSGVLLGVWGVEPNTDLRWQPPLSYSEISPATMEYQICFKCHSGYALQEIDGIAGFSGPSAVLITDQAMEFSKANRSLHPVRVALNDQSGSYSPRNLTSDKLKAPWNTNVGTQTMYCSDCHGNNTTTPSGPHASSNRFMLGGNWSWPYRPTDGKLWTLNDVRSNQNSWGSRLLCAKCHTLDFTGQSRVHPHLKVGHSNSYAAEPYSSYDTSFACVACHIPVPHGSTVSRLIGYDTLPEPYTIEVAPGVIFPVIRQFKKETYSKRSCFIPNTGACHAAHTMELAGD